MSSANYFKIPEDNLPSLVDDVVKVVGEHYQVDRRHLLGRARDGRSSAARQVCYWILNDKWGFNDREIAEVFGRDISTISYGIKRADENSEYFEEIISRLEETP